MADMEMEELIKLNKQGLIPGPGESEESFARRANYALNLYEVIGSLDEAFSSPNEKEKSKALIEESSGITLPLFDMCPSWAPIFFTGEKLSPWHAGCALIFQVEESKPVSAFFQLKKHFKTASSLFGIYSRKELIAHESCHIGRMVFEEPKFEEILAYRTAFFGFRRWFGPLLQTQGESLLLFLSLLLVFALDVFMLGFGYEEAYFSLMPLKLIPIGLVVFFICRLFLRQRTFNRCLKNLQMLLKKEQTANAVIYRLTDQEIERLSKMKTEDIYPFIAEQAASSLRLKLILAAYFQAQRPAF